MTSVSQDSCMYVGTSRSTPEAISNAYKNPTSLAISVRTRQGPSPRLSSWSCRRTCCWCCLFTQASAQNWRLIFICTSNTNSVANN